MVVLDRTSRRCSLIVAEHDRLDRKAGARRAASARSPSNGWQSNAAGNRAFDKCAAMSEAGRRRRRPPISTGLSSPPGTSAAARRRKSARLAGDLRGCPTCSCRATRQVATIRDLTAKDRIAVPAVKVSLPAVMLQMAAADEWGIDALRQARSAHRRARRRGGRHRAPRRHGRHRHRFRARALCR